MNTESTETTNGSTNPDDRRIPVDTESTSADWVKWASRERTLPLAALKFDGRTLMVFVPDEVLIDDADPDLVKLLVDQFGAEIILTRLALAEGLAAMHACWWGAQRFSELGATMHTARHILSFVSKSEACARQILNRFSNELEPHWPDAMRTLLAKQSAVLIERTKNDHGFTLVHGDVGHQNVLVPRIGDRPIYIIDRQTFDWALTTC